MWRDVLHIAPWVRGVSLAVIVVMTVVCVPACTAHCGEKMLLVGFEKDADAAPDALPREWEHLTYLGKSPNSISIEQNGPRTVVHMESLHSVSALLKKIDIGTAEYPLLAWRWKVSRSIGMAIENRKDRNDCAARIRVIFGTSTAVSREKVPLLEKFLETLDVEIPSMEPAGYKIDYIWGSHAEAGAVLDYPGSKFHKMIVLEQGDEKAQRWIWEKRYPADDFRRLFGKEPPGMVAILVITDTDNTNEGVEAWYSSIVVMNE